MRYLLISSFALFGAAVRAEEPVRFNRDIRPILSENCFLCHGPDSAKRKADLRLDTSAGMFSNGESGPVVVKGQPAKSGLFQRVFSDELHKLMPPAKSNKKLTGAQKDLLKRWIEQGAVFENHWSFVAPVRPALPSVKDAAWVKNPIDAFILARLEKMGLRPGTEADRRALIRRATLDLTGLPPTPAEVEAFVNDRAPNAYEKLLDRLLGSEHYGEHRARYWLDAARYGDTHGLHFDNYREMWPFRDWVIAAFNRNRPFDRFTIEQLAGDLLPNRTPEQLIASGFHRCNITTNEGGSINEEVLVGYARDRVETTATVWLGLTAQCCECHNHKFDPLAQKEFYQFAAFFRNTTQGAMDGNIPDTPPIVVVPSMADRPRWEELQKRAGELKARQETRKNEGKKAFDAWLAKGEASKLGEPLDPSHETFALAFPKNETKHSLPKSVTWRAGPVAESHAVAFGAREALKVADAAGLESDRPFSLSTWIHVPTAEGNYTVLSKVGSGAKDKGHGWRLTLNNRILTFSLQATDPKEDALVRNVNQPRLDGGKWTHLCITYDGKRQANGLLVYVNGKQAAARTLSKELLKGSLANQAPLLIGSDFQGGAIAEVRLLDRAVNPEEITILSGWLGLRGELAKSAAKLSPASQAALGLLYFNRFDPVYRKAVEEANHVGEEVKDIARRSPVTHVMNERPGVEPTARVLFRGQYDQPRDEVKAGVFSVLPPLPKGEPNNRLGLAKWLVSPEHPLTARVAVNRFWQEVFGVGIVRTAEDLGSTGEPPSHPELLDWLAVEFRESGWDVKKLMKLMLTSATYRQSAHATAEKREKDPQNRALSRGPRFRMDGEVLRDQALAASGLLVRKVGGASVKPYQPEGVWEAVGILGASNTREYRVDKGEGLYRRSMYWFWKRMAPPAPLDIFNAPSRETCSVRRERSNTPLQALVTMNDPQYVEAARHLAQLALGGAVDDARRIDLMTMRLVARPFRPEESKIAQESLGEFLAYYRANPKETEKLLSVGESRPPATMEAPTLAAWTMLANQLMNLDEVLNK